MSIGDRFILLLALGFGFGKIPKAPGTFGTLPGLLLFWLCLLPGSIAGYISVAIGFIFLSIFLCGRAERILSLKDPGSIVFDEMIALPICLASWSIPSLMQGPKSIEYFFTENRWITMIVYFALFRIFDIAKPWPVKQSQAAPGGWGVTIDDVLAAFYTAIAGGVLLKIIPSLPR